MTLDSYAAFDYATNPTTDCEQYCSTTLSFDEDLIKEVQKKERRKRKNGPDRVQLIAEQYQQSKDPRLWSTLYDLLWDGLVQHCCTVSRNYAIAQDTAAEIMLRAYERIDEYDPTIAKFNTWVWMMGFRQSLRDNTIEARHPIAISSFTAEDSAITDIVTRESRNQMGLDYYGDAYEPDIEINERLYQESVNELYDTSVGEIQNIEMDTTRQVLTMKLIENKTIREISETLHLTESNVKNHLYKGKRDLADKIKKHHADLYDTYVDTGYVVYNN